MSAAPSSSTPPDVILDVRDLVTTFDTDAGTLTAVDGVSLQVRRGRTLGVVGESGCGKSVTALSIMRLLPQPMGRIRSGKILFEGEDISSLPIEAMRRIRGGKIGMIFQEPMTALNPVHSIGRQLSEVFLLHRTRDRGEALQWPRQAPGDQESHERGQERGAELGEEVDPFEPGRDLVGRGLGAGPVDRKHLEDVGATRDDPCRHGDGGVAASRDVRGLEDDAPVGVAQPVVETGQRQLPREPVPYGGWPALGHAGVAHGHGRGRGRPLDPLGAPVVDLLPGRP